MSGTIDGTPADRVRAALETSGRQHLKGEALASLADQVDPGKFLDPLGGVDQAAVETFIAQQVKASPRDRLTAGAAGRREAQQRFVQKPDEDDKALQNGRSLRGGKAGADEARRRFGNGRRHG